VYYQIHAEDKKYFITSYDMYSLRRGLQVFKKIEEPLEVTKVIFSREIDPQEEKFFDYISKGLKIKWGKIVLYFPFDFSDQNAIFINKLAMLYEIIGGNNTTKR
jgi:hypothetical protein